MIVTLVSVETVLLVLLVVLVAGLLRSHAEIMRRLGPGDEPGIPPAPVAGVTTRAGGSEPAPELAGATPSGDAVKLAFHRGAGMPTLLAFLTSGCSSCAEFWGSLADRPLPAGVRTVIVTHGAERERAVKLRSLSPAGVPVVMSSQAWADYEVPGSPYFVLIDGGVIGEGVATTWHALASLVGDALEDQREAGALAGGSDGSDGSDGSGGAAGERRTRRIDDTLAAAGIGPGHPSLYPDVAGPKLPEPGSGDRSA